MRKTCVVAPSAVVFVSASAFAQVKTSAVDPVPEPTFAYTTPAEPKPLRALLELGAVFTLGFAWYATTAPTVQGWDPGYRWSVFRQKLTGTRVDMDANSHGTNFIGHPLGGTGYYLAARSNRLTILESFGFALAGSLLWEVFGEVSEVVSVNDMITTPLAGLAIGEATTQLAAHFDRSEATGANRTWGAVFGPIKTINDAIDGLEPARAKGGAGSDWHRFQLEAAATFARADPTATNPDVWWPEARLSASSELVHLPGYERDGADGHWFDDGNVSSLALTATVGENSLSDLAFETQVVLAGGYYRARRHDRNGDAWGGNGVLGVGSGFQYTLHEYRRGEGRAMDRIASVRPFEVVFQQRGALGGPVLVTKLDVGPDFGGVTPAGVGSYTGARGQLPVVQQARGYYFGIGGHLRAEVGLENGPLRLEGNFMAEGFRDVGDRPPNAVALSDRLVLFGGSLGYREPRTGFMPRAFVERRSRAGSVGRARGSLGETTLGLGMGAVF